MLYFAELSGKRVVSGGKTVGSLWDLLFLATGQPLVTKMSITTRDGMISVPVTGISLTERTVTLPSSYAATVVSNNELSVREHLLDQQIIDIKGNKVVRVNDVAIQEKPYPVVAGVDVGVLGIARWMHVEQVVNSLLARIGKNAKGNFLSWENIQPVELSRGKVMLKQEETKLTKLPPEDLADHLERLSVRNLTKILDLLPSEYEADVVQNLNVSHQKNLFRTIKPRHAAQILSLIDHDEAADILLSLPLRKRDAIIQLLTPESRDSVSYLMSVSTTDIGNAMTNEYFQADPEETAGNVRRRIKARTESFSSFSYVYVINKRSELTGVFDLHELILQDLDTRVYRFMTPNVIAASLTTPVSLALKKMAKYKIHTLPLIDEKRHILGVVMMEDLVESIQEKLV
jgi:magnesium transporter